MVFYVVFVWNIDTIRFMVIVYLLPFSNKIFTSNFPQIEMLTFCHAPYAVRVVFTQTFESIEFIETSLMNINFGN